MNPQSTIDNRQSTIDHRLPTTDHRLHFGIGADPDTGGGIWDGFAKPRNRKFLALVDKEFHSLTRSLAHSLPVLDVGSGDSLMRRMLIKRFGSRNMYTIDIDLNLLSYPRSWSNQFGAIFSTETLEHLLNPHFHLRQLRRLVKPDGHLFIATPNDYSLVYKAQHLLSIRHHSHFHQYNIPELKYLLSITGWQVQTIVAYHRPDSGILSMFSRNGIFVNAVPNRQSTIVNRQSE